MNVLQSEWTRAYTAGFVDGESHIYKNKDGYVRVEIPQKTLPVLNFLKMCWGGSLHQYGKNKMWRLSITGKYAVNMLGQIKDYLIVKQEVVESLKLV